MSIEYLIDTNFFIQAHRYTYPLDVAESFWLKIKELVKNNVIVSIDKVKSEIFLNDDDLKIWCQENINEDFWNDTSDLINQEYSELIAWAVSKNDRYIQSAIMEFANADKADAFLLAYAMNDKENRIIVTSEITSNSKKKIKIPDVCFEHNIKFIKPMEMFRELEIKF